MRSRRPRGSGKARSTGISRRVKPSSSRFIATTSKRWLPPFAALAAWFRRVADYAKVKRGVFGAVTSAMQSDLSSHSLGSIGGAITSLLDAGKADGTVRDDADARDVILLIGYLTRLDENEWDARAHHLLDIILDGLRRPASTRTPSACSA